jgi:hypothetical protein
MNHLDIERVIRSASTSTGWSFSQLQLFNLYAEGFNTNFECRRNFVVKSGFGSVSITNARNFKLDAWEYQRGLGLEPKIRYFKTFQSLLNYLKKVS